MRQDAKRIRDGSVIQGDICIVGGGPAGITLAGEFIAHSARVIWLESGGIGFDEGAQTLNEGTFTGAEYAGLRKTRHRQAGGTAHTWNTPVDGDPGAKYVPLDSLDFEPRPATGEIGWPFDRAHLEPYYERAQTVCGLGPFAYEAERWCEERPTFSIPDRCLHRSVYQFGLASRFTDCHEWGPGDSENIVLLYHATACSLDMADNGRSAVAVEAATLAGNRFRVRARLFIVAAGGIENARLLLASREPGHAAPGNGHDWLGRCFMEHPRDRALSLIPRDPEIYDQAAFYDRHTALDGTVVAGRIALDGDVVVREGLLNASVTLVPLLRERWLSRRRLRRLARKSINAPEHRPTAAYGWSKTDDPVRSYAGIQILMNTEQYPDPENRVVLSEDVDALGVPKPSVHWKWRARDQSNLVRLRSVVGDALSAMGIGRVEINPRANPDPNAHHHMGTTRMHRDPRAGVVDPHSRVHGTDNLYLAGSSVFPTGGYANPTLTIVALALRLADHIKYRL